MWPFKRKCDGIGQQTLSPMVDKAFDKPEPDYEAQCPKCGKAQPCTGRGVLLPHYR